jgi:hypothetical protein
MRKKSSARTKRDVERLVGGNDVRRFASFVSLYEWAVEQGYATSVEAIEQTERAVWSELLFAWYPSGQIVCLFAIHFAGDWQAAQWFSAIVAGEWDGDVTLALFDAHLEVGAEGLQLLFPGSGSSYEVVEIVNQLAQHPRWHCEDTGWLEGEAGDSIHVGIRWISPNRSYDSLAVGNAPFEAMPFTRKFVGAPFMALIIRPTPPFCGRAPATNGSTGPPAAHLAHMDDALKDNEVKRSKWNEGAKLAKRALIHPEPLSRARAKVRLVFQQMRETPWHFGT